MVTQLQELLGLTIPQQFEPLLTLMAAEFLLLGVAYFADVLKLLILRR
ncbi:MAG TPA: hypothetical protein IAA51_06750 [Candidatus Cottocaccamicrobium excrementipullorum]|nr:hypothetical protein [Candidatus Cottocaccamicrobium excrementipullorum]